METSSIAILKPAPVQPLQRARVEPAHEPVIVQPVLEPKHDKLLELDCIESPAKRWGFAALAILIALLLFCFTSSYWAPAHDGNNQNGYLVGGKFFARSGSTGFEPKSPFSFVGWMWVMADAKSAAPGGGWTYPKYPLGVPMLVAAALRLGGAAHGVEWAYRISPICMTLAVLAMFFLAQPITGSFAAIMAMLLLASGQVGLILTNNPNSHAPAMFYVMWGMFFLLLWWRRDRWWQAALAGFLLGFATTIRYTEGLLLIPLLIVVMLKLRWRFKRSYLRVSVPIGAWLVPVAYLVIFNLVALHSWTGYDSTNESEGFSWENFSDKWSFAIGQLYWTGLYFVLPLAVAGLALAFRWNWRIAVILCAWILPGSILYMSYYYGLGMPLIGYLRFFTTLLPPAFLVAAWLLQEASRPGSRAELSGSNHRSIAGPIGIGVFVAIVSAVNMRTLVPSLERDYTVAANLADVGARVRTYAPSGSVVFGPSQRLLNYLQFAGDYDLYGSDYFEHGSALPWFGKGERDKPTPIQRARREFLEKCYSKLDHAALIRAAGKICDEAIRAQKRIFVVMPGSSGESWCKTFADSSQFEFAPVTSWTEPVQMSSDAARTIGAVGGMPIARAGHEQWQIVEIRQKARR